MRIWALVLVMLVAGGCRIVREEELSLRAAREGELCVMSFNIRVTTKRDGKDDWEFRKDLVVDVIKEFSPDILGTQEGISRQIEHIDSKLWGYTRIGVGRDDGKTGGEFTTLYLRKGRLQILDSGTFWLSPTPNVPGSKGWDAQYPRVVVWARAIDKHAGRRLMILNTHWDHAGKTARKESAKMIHAWLEQNAKGDPVMMTGDLNSKEDTEQVKMLVDENARPRLLDSYRELNPERQKNESTISLFWGRERGSRIDYIFHTQELEVREAAIARVSREGRYPSDHYPVVAIFEWRAGRLGDRTVKP